MSQEHSTSADLSIDRELSTSELFQRTFAFAWQYKAILLPIFVVAGVLNSIAFTGISSATPSIALPANVQNLTGTQLASIARTTFTVIGYTWLAYFVSWLVLYFAVGIAIWRMGQKNPVSGGSPRLNYSSLAVATFLTVLIISLGLFLVLIGAMILGTILYLSIAACVLEGKGAGSSIGRGRQLVSGRWGKTMALLIGIYIIAYFVSYLVGSIAAFAIQSVDLSNLVFNIVQSFVVALAYSLVASSMLVLYYSNQSVGHGTRNTTPLATPPSPYDSMRPEPMWPRSSSPAPPPPPPPQLSDRRFCSNCGVQLGMDENFCHNCGAARKH